MMEKDFKKALVIGIGGSLSYKVFEWFIHFFGFGINLSLPERLIQLMFLTAVSLVLILIINKINKDPFFAVYVAPLYYIIKESYNVIFVSQGHLTSFLFSPAIFETIIALFFGYAMYTIVERYWK